MGRPRLAKSIVRARRHTKMVVGRIGRIRRYNNNLWMDLLRLAVDSSPRKARAIIKAIRANDRSVTRWMQRL